MTEQVTNAVGAGEAVLAEGLAVSDGAVQDKGKHAERRANAIKAMKAEMAKAAPAAPPVENDNAETPSSPETPDAKKAANENADPEKTAANDNTEADKPADDATARQERVKKFLAAKSEKGELHTLKAQMAEMEARHKQREEQIRNEERQSLLGQLQKAPKELLSAHQLSPEQLLQAAMEEATQDPVKLLEKRYAALEAQLKAERDERAQWQKQLQEREQQAIVERGQQQMLSAALDADKFPALSARYSGGDTRTLLQLVHETAEEYRSRTGHYPPLTSTDSEEGLLDFLNSQEEEVFARYKSSSAKAAHSAPEKLKSPGRIGNGLTPSEATQATGAPPPKAISHEERLRRARASEAMARRNAERGQLAK